MSNSGLANSSVGPYDPDQGIPTLQPVPLEQLGRRNVEDLLSDVRRV